MTLIADYIGRSARDNVLSALDKAQKNEQYHALLSLTRERALERADAVGAPTTAASKMLEGFNAPLQATAVEKLEAEGAICIGKANLDAFAHGGSTENSAFGPTLNAFDITRVAGGSSGGSAVVTALDIVPFALGSDTGGSIRQPASFNGVVGMKPTYGTISRYGVVAMASSTDVIGVLTSSVADAELVTDIMAGKDAKDMTTLADFFVPKQTIEPGKKIGLIKEFMTDDVDSEVRQRTLEYAQRLRDNGHIVEEVSLPIVAHTLAMYYIIVPAEVSSNLARYDGIRYGHRAEGVSTLAELYGRTRDEGFVTENKRRIMIGSYVLSSGFFDAYYLKAQKARTILINEFNALFEQYDMLLGPVTPTPAFKIGENTSDPIKMYLADIMTVPASLAGLPALSVPAGISESGLPIGVQFIGQRRSDADLLALARSLEIN
jgi:aspartyl-tRNA(Asn)/glutamyl-tRNA(Gln) amidotransferase subunit A